ncbi:TetR/AcrR family transcriptional regulator [Streptomyces fulvoviolaceus]|uniref:TetR/AcrR family transcriptional regulator n=1 Tax=Streptomyces fulvoviolaceus TaxID=285535 RepID=UPI0004C865D0|nr:TetR/AcrR family transcriptional regulator [Streptomyces fulvoviolaceus]
MELASERPIGEVSVADVARRAGVTRTTVYNHAPTPVELLCLFLGEEIDEITNAFIETVEGTVEPDIRAAVSESARGLFRHVARHSRIYEQAQTTRFDPVIGDVLGQHFEVGLRAHVTSHPEIIPGYAELADDPAALALATDIHVAFSAQGAVGAVGAWLRRPPPRDIEAGAVAIMHSTPEWWFQTPPRRVPFRG